MAIPEQVERKFREVEDHYKQQAEAQKAAQEPSADSEAEEVVDQTADQGAVEVVEHEAPASQAEPTIEAQPDTQSNQLAELKAQLDKANQRYRTLEGMLKAKDYELKQMQALIAQMSESAPQPVQNTPTPEVVSDKEDRENFGDDFVDMVHRIAGAKVAELVKRIEKLESQGAQTQKITLETQQERFYNRLTQRVPDWREIDSTPEFAAWLKESPTRVAFVQQAMQNFDSDGIAEIFEQYKLISGISGKGSDAKQSTDQDTSRKLSRKVAPSKGRASAPTSTSDGKRIWTRSEIAQVYRDRRRIPAKEFAELEREIFAAQRENRVDFTR